MIGNGEKKNSLKKYDITRHNLNPQIIDQEFLLLFFDKNRPRNCDKSKQKDYQNWCKHFKLKTKNAKRVFQF